MTKRDQLLQDIGEAVRESLKKEESPIFSKVDIAYWDKNVKIAVKALAEFEYDQLKEKDAQTD